MGIFCDTSHDSKVPRYPMNYHQPWNSPNFLESISLPIGGVLVARMMAIAFPLPLSVFTESIWFNLGCPRVVSTCTALTYAGNEKEAQSSWCLNRLRNCAMTIPFTTQPCPFPSRDVKRHYWCFVLIPFYPMILQCLNHICRIYCNNT